MSKINIGVICPSEIAFRRFLPALQKNENFNYKGVAVADSKEWNNATSQQLSDELNKAMTFKERYGGRIYSGYQQLIDSDDVDAVYLPLPPALHFKWGEYALKKGKHVFVEKPSSTCSKDTHKLVELAKAKELALHENYMFIFHNQLGYIRNIINDKEIGDVRLYRIAFGFPKRNSKDFRYNKALGGGALLDCGGYTLKLASELLGEDTQLVCSQLNYTDEFNVDIYGSATMTNKVGVTAQIAFGMDNSYRCELEVWGSKGSLRTNRVFTAPAGFEPEITIENRNGTKTIKLPSDDTFLKSLEHFHKCIIDKDIRSRTYDELIRQSNYVDQIKE